MNTRMASTALSAASGPCQPSDGRKRVRRACEYCRRKRLKCTSDRRPCLNCQLYGAECVAVPEPPGPRIRRRRVTVANGHARDGENGDALPVNELPEPPRDPSLGSEEGDQDQVEGSVNNDINLDTVHVLQDAPSGLFTSPGAISLSGFQQTADDANLGLPPDFWGLNNFMAGHNAPDEQAATDQLLSLQSPPATDADFAPKSLSRGKGSVGRIFGVEGLASPPTTTLGAISPGIFHHKDKGNSLFLGYTSTAAVLTLCVRGSSAENHHLADSEPLVAIADCGPMCDEISCKDKGDIPAHQIPCNTLAAQCVNAFFEDYHASHPIANRRHVELILERFVSHGHQSLGPLDRSMLYLITALGACSRPALCSNLSSMIDNLYALAWGLFPHAVAAPSFVSVQILLLHVLYNLHWSKWSIAWVLSGIAARIAQSIGLHKVTPPDFSLDHEQTRSRVQLWAVTVILDAQLSLSQGRPPACQPSQCDAELLSTKSTLLHVVELRWPLSHVLTWRVPLARMQQKLNIAFSSEIMAGQRSSCVEEVDLELMKWKEELPPEFQPDQQTILDGDAHIDIYMLHLDYFHLLQTIHWALINHRPEPYLATHAAPRLRASERICLGASLAVARTLNAMADENTRARSFRSRSDHFITAMAIIYRSILRNPSRLSARTDLEYLRVIRRHLGRMAGEHLLAVSLTSLFENMVRSAEQLVLDHSSEPTLE